MAIDILSRYGIKEVADVVFYQLNAAGMPEYPVLYLDTLKVSTIEQTAEEAEARGGKGNAALIAWDYGKEINVTLEDALFSAKSMAIMFGNGRVKSFSSEGEDGTNTEASYIMKTIQIIPTTAGEDPSGESYEAPDGKLYKKLHRKYFNANGEAIADRDMEANVTYFCTFDLAASGAIIEVSANSFPGTYYVVGDTFARSEASGIDEMFQFIIPKAKVTSDNTITLEAEGDPSVFNMNLKVLRPADGKMMKLVKYSLEDAIDEATEDAGVLVHNHVLNEVSEG